MALDVLRRFPHFAGLSEASLERISRISKVRTFEQGERLFEEGDTAAFLMLILFGEVNLVYKLGDGREVVADTLLSGDSLAWSSILQPHTLTASAVARKAGSLLEIEAGGLRSMCEEDKEFGYHMMKEVATMLRSRLSAMRVQIAASHAEPA